MSRVAYIPLSNSDEYAIVDKADLALVSGYTWSLVTQPHKKKGPLKYVVAPIPGQWRKTARMHRVVMGVVGSEKVDHVDENGLNNRRRNLRRTNSSQNAANRLAPNANNTSGFKGVVYDRIGRTWRAQVRLKGRAISIGSFSSAQQAAEIRKEAEVLAYEKFSPLSRFGYKTKFSSITELREYYKGTPGASPVSGYKGIWWNRKRRRWCVRLSGGRYGGRYLALSDAVAARAAAT